MKTRTLSFLSFLLVLALLCAAPLPAAANVVLIDQAAALAGGISGTCDAPGFPVTICKPGSYRLTGDLVVPSGLDGIDILANDVTLDLNGFSIRGPLKCSGFGPSLSCNGSPSSFGIVSSDLFNNVSVHSGNVKGFGTGVSINGAGTSVDDLRVSQNSFYGISIADGLVTRCIATFNGGTGIVAVRSQIKGNTSNYNKGDGFDLGGVSGTQNAADFNGGYGFNANGTLLSNNQSSDNSQGDFFSFGGLTSPGNNNCSGNSC